MVLILTPEFPMWLDKSCLLVTKDPRQEVIEMELFQNRKLIVKMMGGFVITSVITMAVGLFGARAIETESGAIKRIYTRDVEQVSDLKEAQILLLRAFSGQKNALVAYTPELRTSFLKEVELSRNGFDRILVRLQQATFSKDQDRIATISQVWGEFEKANDQVVAKLKADQVEQAFLVSNGEASQKFTVTQNALQALVDHRKAESNLEYQNSIARNQQSRFVMLTLCIVGVGMGLAIGYIISKAVSGPIKKVVDGLLSLERGDLTQTIGLHGEDEVGILAATYDNLTMRLREVMRDVQLASTNVEQAVAQVSSCGSGNEGNHRLGRTSTIEETAVAMHQILESSQRNAQLSSDAAERFSLAKNSAGLALAAMNQMIVAVTDINDSSHKISKIIHVMDEIALKTNLLALNAAVEAAHAGEQGKGFAVVAAEVRSLAQRSAEAAKDINTLIADSVQKAAGGKSLAEQSGSALADITNQMEQVSQMVRDISDGSSMQRQAIEGANKSISAINKTMQQNSQQVVRLREVAGYFKVDVQ